MPEDILDGPMNIGTAHRLVSQRLDDRSLDLAIAEPAAAGGVSERPAGSIG
jgi:hypothetical protein